MLLPLQTGHRAIAQGRAQVWSEACGPRVTCGGSAFGPCEGTWLPRPRPTAEGKGWAGPAAGSSLQDTGLGSRHEAGPERTGSVPDLCGLDGPLGEAAAQLPDRKGGETRIKQSQKPSSKTTNYSK